MCIRDRTWKVATQVTEGWVSSITSTSKVQLAGPLPLGSVYSQVTVVVPKGKVEPEAKPDIRVPGMPIPPQLSAKSTV